jgi:succinyl-diaminopimelate desuccinylase
VLGEPSNQQEMGDCIKVGRRGSQSGTLYVDGVQGHVAYPHRASNPVPDISRLIVAISEAPLDHGSAQFQPSNLEFVSVDVDNGAFNIIPGQARATFNIRYNDLHTQASLRELIERRLAKAAGNRIKARIVWEPSNANVFLTKPGAFTDLAVSAIEEVTGRKPELSTTGGTSDARFIASYCPVIEFGLLGQTMHQVDERASVKDLEMLTRVYRGILDRYFGWRTSQLSPFLRGEGGLGLHRSGKCFRCGAMVPCPSHAALTRCELPAKERGGQENSIIHPH